MKQLINNNLKLAIQKKGRLTEDTITLLRSIGLEFESYSQRLYSGCRNFPVDIIFLRDDDIPDYVERGAVDVGIVGGNMVEETGADIKRIMPLDYGYCELALAVPKESKINSIAALRGKTIATSYPSLTKRYLKKADVQANIAEISGSVEIAPALKMADAIVDLVSTGSTLALNDLRVVEKVFQSQAVLISSKKISLNKEKNILLEKLLTRIRGVLAAKDYKYIMMNAPEKILPKLQEAVPGLKSPTVSPLAVPGWVSIQTVVKEDVFWETIEKLKQAGATGILVLPIEKLII